MSNFKFVPKRGIIANVSAFIRSTTATAAVSAANGLVVAQTLNKTISDGLAVVNEAEEMAMNNVANYFSEQLGEEITVQDIREGNLSEKIEAANAANRILAAKRGQLRKAKEEMKLQKKLQKIQMKLAALEQK